MKSYLLCLLKTLSQIFPGKPLFLPEA
uniref:Uncharacterized protein n=1 Tax=Anguilla anguilla TaxID=7936 RepID=A0A0E9UT05_ANGAN